MKGRLSLRLPKQELIGKSRGRGTRVGSQASEAQAENSRAGWSGRSALILVAVLSLDWVSLGKH